jgi:hypothetical protein
MFGMLLAGNSTSVTVTSYIVGVAILAAMFYFIWKRLSSSKEGQAELQNFFDSLQDIIKNRVAEFIDKFDFTNIPGNDLPTMEATFFDNLYNDIWTLCVEELTKLQTTDSTLYTILKKVITKDKVKEYVSTLYSDDDIKAKFEKLYTIAMETKLKEVEKQDQDLQKEQDAYDNGSVTTDTTVPTLDPTTTDGKASEDPIIPPTDEPAEVVNPATDGSVEVVDYGEEVGASKKN